MSARIAILPCLTLALFLGACDKSTGTSPENNDNKAMLVAADWKMTGHTVAPAVDLMEDGVLVSDLWNTTSDCIRDDVTTFKADGTFSVDAGTTKCGEEEQTDTGTWSLNAAGDVLTMTYTAFPITQVQKINGLSATGLRLSHTSTGWPDGKSHTGTLVYTAQ